MEIIGYSASILMVFASYSMIKKDIERKVTDQKPANNFWVIIQGLVVSLVTGHFSPNVTKVAVRLMIISEL